MTQSDEPRWSGGDVEVERVNNDNFRETLTAPMPSSSYRDGVDLTDGQPSAVGQLLRYFATVLIALIGIRFVINMFTLDRSGAWVSFFYLTTDWIVRPFQGMFGQSPITGSTGFVDWAALTAMAVVIVAAWLLSLIFRPHP